MLWVVLWYRGFGIIVSNASSSLGAQIRFTYEQARVAGMLLAICFHFVPSYGYSRF